jgi:hypothetical protein
MKAALGECRAACKERDHLCQISRPARQDLALNLSAKRRLCDTVGGRGIEGSARCCAISIARSRAAATTNLARPNQSWVLRTLFAGAKNSALVKLFMILPPDGG